MSTLKYKLQKYDTYLLILEEEVIDFKNSSKLKNIFNQLLDKSFNFLEIDMQHVRTIDSSGMGLFVHYNEKFSKDSRKITLKNLQKGVIEVFKVVGIDKVFNL